MSVNSLSLVVASMTWLKVKRSLTWESLRSSYFNDSCLKSQRVINPLWSLVATLLFPVLKHRNTWYWTFTCWERHLNLCRSNWNTSLMCVSDISSHVDELRVPMTTAKNLASTHYRGAIVHTCAQFKFRSHMKSLLPLIPSSSHVVTHIWIWMHGYTLCIVCTF